MSNEQAQQVTYVEFPRLSMFVESTKEGERAKMAFGFRAGNPRISVFPNATGDAGTGPIYAGIDPTTFSMFLNQLGLVVTSSEPRGETMECYGSKFERNQRVQGKALLSTLHYWKDGLGIVWLSLRATGRPEINFPFILSEWHVFKNAQGVPLSKAEGSVLMAKAFIRVWQGYLSSYESAPFTKSTVNIPSQDRRPVSDDRPKERTQPAVVPTAPKINAGYDADIGF